MANFTSWTETNGYENNRVRHLHGKRGVRGLGR